MKSAINTKLVLLFFAALFNDRVVEKERAG